jgi:Ca2+-binding EF-hand superfamily protein
LSNNTGWITFEQFKQFMQVDTDTFKNPLVIIELKQAFNEVDTNKDGFISPQEAYQGITLAGQYIPGPSFNQVIQMFDDDGDGQMALEEFLNNVKKLFTK